MGAGGSKGKRGASKQAQVKSDADHQNGGANKPTTPAPTEEKRASVGGIRPMATTHSDSMLQAERSALPGTNRVYSPVMEEEEHGSASPRFSMGIGMRYGHPMSPKIHRPSSLALLRGDIAASPIASVKGSSKWLLKRASAEDLSDFGGPKDKAAAGTYIYVCIAFMSIRRSSRNHGLTCTVFVRACTKPMIVPLAPRHTYLFCIIVIVIMARKMIAVMAYSSCISTPQARKE
jgi:hypothetical protein